MSEIEQLKKQIDGMQEIIIALIILQDRMTKYKLRKAYPQLDKMMNDMWIDLI